MNWNGSLNQQKIIGVIFLRLLIELFDKLKIYGMCAKMLEWLRNCLSNRTHETRLFYKEDK